MPKGVKIKTLITKEVIRGELRNYLARKVSRKMLEKYNYVFQFNMEDVRTDHGRLVATDFVDNYFSNFPHEDTYIRYVTFYIDNIMREFLYKNGNAYVVANRANLRELYKDFAFICKKMFSMKPN